MINQNNKCYVCGSEINVDRLQALEVLGVNPSQQSCLNCAPNKFKKGIFMGMSGVSPLVLADSLGDGRIIRDNSNYSEFKE